MSEIRKIIIDPVVLKRPTSRKYVISKGEDIFIKKPINLHLLIGNTKFLFSYLLYIKNFKFDTNTWGKTCVCIFYHKHFFIYISILDEQNSHCSHFTWHSLLKLNK